MFFIVPCEWRGSGVALVLFSVPPLFGGYFWACICAPFGMNGVASGAFSGSFRCGAFFSLSDA